MSPMNPQQRMHKVPVFVKNSSHKKQYVIEGLRRTENINLIDNMSNMPTVGHHSGSEIDDQGLCELNFRLANNKHMQPLASAMHFTVCSQTKREPNQRSASLVRNEPIVRFFLLPIYIYIYYMLHLQ